jgi:hypothetical protein
MVKADELSSQEHEHEMLYPAEYARGLGSLRPIRALRPPFRLRLGIGAG